MGASYIAAAQVQDSGGQPWNFNATFNVQAHDVFGVFFKCESGDTTPSISSTGNSFTIGTVEGETKFTTGTLTGYWGWILDASAENPAQFALSISPSRSFIRAIIFQFRPDSGEAVSFDVAKIVEMTGTALTTGNVTTTGTDEMCMGGYGESNGISPTSLKINGVAATQPVAPIADTTAWYTLPTGTFTGDASGTLASSNLSLIAILALKSSPTSGPTLSTTTPADNATGVNPYLKELVLTFAENVQAGTGNVVLKDDTLGTTIATVAIGSASISTTTVTVPIDLMLEYGHAYHVEVDSGAIEKASDSSDWPGIADSATWNFTALNRIDFVAAGAAGFSAASGTTITAAWPGTATNEKGIDILAVGLKPATAGGSIVGVPEATGFRLLGKFYNGGGGTFGADTGATDLWVFWRPASPETSGNFTVADVVGTNGVAWAKIWRFKSNVAGAVRPLASFGNQSATGNVSVVFDSSPAAWKTRPGDLLFAIFSGPTDVNSGAQYSAHALTQSGVTFSPIVEESEWASGNGNDIGAFAAYAQVLVGRGLDKITLAATAATNTNVRGPAALVRLRVN